MRSVWVAALCALAVAGCATIVKGTDQAVAVSTPGVSGATCTLTSPSIGTHTVITPDTLTLKKGKEAISVRCTKECYIDGVGVIPSNLQSLVAGNVITGGLIGLGIDAASGAINEYAPEVQVTMTPDPKCKAPEEPKRKQSLSVQNKPTRDGVPKRTLKTPPESRKPISKREKPPKEEKPSAEEMRPIEKKPPVEEMRPVEEEPPVDADPAPNGDAEKLINWGKRNIRPE